MRWPLSPGTEDYDRGEKREQYQQIETLLEYIVLAQDRRHIEVWRRSDNQWSHEVLAGDQTLRLETLEGEIGIATLYEEAGLVIQRQ